MTNSIIRSASALSLVTVIFCGTAMDTLFTPGAVVEGAIITSPGVGDGEGTSTTEGMIAAPAVGGSAGLPPITASALTSTTSGL